jgi:hypothetical protein
MSLAFSKSFHNLHTTELVPHACDSNVNSNLVLMVTIYVCLYGIFCAIKPTLAFDERGRFRPFGVSNKHMSIFAAPVWVAGAAIASCFVPLVSSVYSSYATV